MICGTLENIFGWAQPTRGAATNPILSLSVTKARSFSFVTLQKE